MKKTCTNPSAMALPVSWNTQMDWAKAVILVARTEISWPSQTIVKAAIPAGLPRPGLEGSCTRFTRFASAWRPVRAPGPAHRPRRGMHPASP